VTRWFRPRRNDIIGRFAGRPWCARIKAHNPLRYRPHWTYKQPDAEGENGNFRSTG